MIITIRLRNIVAWLLPCLFLLTASGFAAENPDPGVDFDLTCNNMTATFKKFMKCNDGRLPEAYCNADFASFDFMFNDKTVEKLQNYYFVLVPGGDFDFFGEFLDLCEGGTSEDFEDFRESNPHIGDQLHQAIMDTVCPAYRENVAHYYHQFMGAYQVYVAFMEEHNIPHKWLAYHQEQAPTYIGDRRDKLDLLATTIEALESDNGTPDKQYVLMGHSFGGLNISDFLVELVEGHEQGTPEYTLFKDMVVRNWSTEKKEEIFNKIRGAVFLNTFVQGDRSSETSLKKIARTQGIQSDDPVGYYIRYVLDNYMAGNVPETLEWKKILQYVLRTVRYRVDYYLTDKNNPAGGSGSAIQDSFDTIADELAIVSVGCVVPRLLPKVRVGANFLVHLSKDKWKNEMVFNDGMVDTFAALFPRPSVDYVVLKNKDHGTLVMKPHVPGISSAFEYDQTPFIKTLLAHMANKMDRFSH